MNDFQELIEYAKKVVHDEGCFSADQITSLHNMIDVLADAMLKTVRANSPPSRLY